MHNKLNFVAVFDIAGDKISSPFFSDERYWNSICVEAEKAILPKYVVLNGRRTFNTISDVVGNSVLVPIQNSVKGFFGKSSFKFESLESSANFS